MFSAPSTIPSLTGHAINTDKITCVVRHCALRSELRDSWQDTVGSFLFSPLLPPSSPFCRLKNVLKCHIPDPSEFFPQLSSEHGGDFQVGVWRRRTEQAVDTGWPEGGLGCGQGGKEVRNSGFCTLGEEM